MKLLNNYSMFNPYEHTRALTAIMLDDIRCAINDQCHIVHSQPTWHIEEVSTQGSYYHITFCLKDYKNNDFALFWEVQVKKDDMLDYVSENYEDVPDFYLEDYFMDYDLKISIEWLNEQDLEELDFIKIVA